MLSVKPITLDQTNDEHDEESILALAEPVSNLVEKWRLSRLRCFYINLYEFILISSFAPSTIHIQCNIFFKHFIFS